MAAPMERRALTFVRKFFIDRSSGHLSSMRCLSSKEGFSDGVETGSDSSDVGVQFMKPEVQRILTRITNFDLDKIFKPKLTKVPPPRYQLLTDQQLAKAQGKAVRMGKYRLQMPPVLPAADVNQEGEVICSDPEIANFDIKSKGVKYVFTDIGYGIKDRERTIVVREQDGRLRHAGWAERNRIIHAYYPRPGRMYRTPSMFSENTLEEVLSRGQHRYILDRACAQFEPDDPEFIRVCGRTYSHMAEMGVFDELRATRHFGPMAFYQARHKTMDSLLLDTLRRRLLQDATDLVKLYYILHPDCPSAKQAEEIRVHTVPKPQREAAQHKVSNAQKLLELYIEHEAQQKGQLELMVQALLEDEDSKPQQVAKS